MKRTMSFNKWHQQFGEIATLGKKVKFNNRTWTVTFVNNDRVVLEE